jgi:hypothetical protein
MNEFRERFVGSEEVRMLDATVELLSGLFLIGLILLIGSCIVGSMVAALRVVNRENVASTNSPKALATFVVRHRNSVSMQGHSVNALRR